MQNNFDYEEITSRAYNYLEEEFSYKYVTLCHYRSRWLPVKEYMEKQGLKVISTAVCKDFLLEFYRGRTHEELTEKEKSIEKSISVLCEYLENGLVQRRCKVRHFGGSIGLLMKDFLALKLSHRLKQITIDKIESHMSNFNFWLSINGIYSVHNIRHHHIITFIKSLDPNKKALIHDTLMDLRGFFKFLYEKEDISTNLSTFIPKDNYQKQAKLPAYYTEEEIDKLLKSVDRGNIVGKRDYAILVIAAYLGLRASDIAHLRFENLHWDHNTIIIRQYKTGKNISLPLLPVVGNALLDYIQYGRPKSDEQYIFLLVISPFLPIRPQAIAGLINRRFSFAGLKSTTRRHGGHALRNSLVKELLNNKQSLPVISEVLGHKNTSSTRHYIRIDTGSLGQCALDVPLVSPLFYNQEGGILWS
ncbi:MAG: site-specific integrase [Bacteroidales bacterium]|jgi:site-specific recombinase XerD|nr:site-specific integrase [Bacteroidales bacterium]